MHVVVVESPAKAKTVQHYLGGDYRVLATWGPCERPAGEGRLCQARQRLRDDLCERSPRKAGAGRDPNRPQGRRQPDPRHRSGPRGRGDRLAGPDLAAGAGRHG